MTKHAFERSVLRGIPSGEAAGFFHRIKTAGWADQPDETGELEGQFAAPLEQVVQKITEVVAAKFRKMVAYHTYGQSMKGPTQHDTKDQFLDHAEHERAHAEAYLKRAAVLGGGPVHLPEIEAPIASADPVGIFRIMIRAEQEAIAAQRELRAMVGEENPMRAQIEEFMVKDQHHLDELWQLSPPEMQLTPPMEEGADPLAAGGQVGMEAPPEEPLPEAEEPALDGAPMEEEPEDPALPPAAEMEGQEAEAPPPPPKATPKPKDEKPTSAAKKEASARARRLLKLAGIQTELTDAMSDEDKAIQDRLKGLSSGERSQGAREALGRPLRDLGRDPLPETFVGDPRKLSPLGEYDLAHRIQDGLISAEDKKILQDHVRAGGGSLFKGRGSPSARPPVDINAAASRVLSSPGALALGVGTGAITGALRGATATGKELKELQQQGPVGRFAAEHPSLTLGGITGAGMALGQLGSRYGLPGVLAGAALPGAAVVGAGKLLKDREAAKTASPRGLRKLGFSSQMMPEPGVGTDPGAAPMPEDKDMVMPQPSMAAPGPQPPMATPPGMAQYAPMNYLEAEETARRAQMANEAGFYQEKLRAADANASSMAEQLAQVQGHLDQLSAQAAESQNQIMMAEQNAVQANDQMLNQATLAARMRMGMQQLRAQMMEIASQDPEQLAAAAGGPTPMDIGMQAQQAQGGPVDPTGGAGMDPTTQQPGGAAEPGAQPGTPEASPAPDTGSGSPPGGAGQASEGGSTSNPEESGRSEDGKKDKGETTVSIKRAEAKIASLVSEMKSRLPYMAAGALIGGAASLSQAKKVPTLREQVTALQGQQDGGFARSLELAKAHMALAQAEEAKDHPVRSALSGGLAGASFGGAVGQAVPWGISGGKRLIGNINRLKNVL